MDIPTRQVVVAERNKNTLVRAPFKVPAEADTWTMLVADYHANTKGVAILSSVGEDAGKKYTPSPKTKT